MRNLYDLGTLSKPSIKCFITKTLQVNKYWLQNINATFKIKNFN